MPTLTTGQQANLVLSAGGSVSLSTNHGFGLYTLKSTNGDTESKNWGPIAHRRVITARDGGTLQILCTTGVVVYTVDGEAKPAEGGGGSGLRSAIMAYKRGLRTRPPILAGIYDSNGTGEGAGTGGGTAPKLTNAFGKGPHEQIAEVTPTLAGLPLRTTSWWGEGNCLNNAVPVTEYNPRLTLGAGWDRTTGSTLFALGGSHMVGSAGSAGYLAYNFGSPITHVEIYMVVNATNSAAVGVYTSANALITTLNTNNATSSVQKFTIAFPLADGIIKVKNNGAANCYVAGMVAWNEAEKAIILSRHSYSGATTGTFNDTTNVWSGMGYYPVEAPDACIVALTINDILAGTSRSTYNTNLAYIADFVARYGDLIVSTGGNGSAGGWTNGTSAGIEAEAKKVAGLYGAPFVSMHKEWVDWNTTNALGQEFDGNHRSATGYRDQARVYANLLNSLLGR